MVCCNYEVDNPWGQNITVVAHKLNYYAVNFVVVCYNVAMVTKNDGDEISDDELEDDGQDSWMLHCCDFTIIKGDYIS